MAGLEKLEMRIRELEEKVAEMRDATREANMLLRDLKMQKKEVERLLGMEDVRKLVHDRVDEVVTTELDRIGPQMREFSSHVYDKVGKQIDMLVDIMLGKELSTRAKNADLRPQLAEKMKVWIREVIEEEGLEIL